MSGGVGVSENVASTPPPDKFCNSPEQISEFRVSQENVQIPQMSVGGDMYYGGWAQA